ncbi:MAG: IDEAL domain-containing protein, partial [Desemzia incerta]
ILEDNPYHRWNDTIPKDVKKDAEHAIIHLNLSEKKQVMLKLIDEALESGNRQEFIEFSTKLKEIDKELLNHQKKTNL